MTRDAFPSRRDLLKFGGWAALGGIHSGWLTPVAQSLAQQAEANPTQRAKSLIFLWLSGGPSQLETFDPHAGKAIAGGTRSIRTSAAAIELAEGLERTAEQAHSIALVRSLVSKEGDHERGVYLMKTGYRPNPTVVHASIGAICCHQLPTGATEIPRHISILPTPWPGKGGMLGAEYDAFRVFDPSLPAPDIVSRVPEDRFQARTDDLSVVEAAFSRGRSKTSNAALHSRNVASALKMMHSDQVRAFDIGLEPDSTRAEYGDSDFGRGCLAARRLIEVGARCVEVTLDSWDSHVNNHEIHRERLKSLDPALARLISDLRERDLLDDTLIVCGGEFGRTPRLNGFEGRDHWPHGFSMLLAGGGIRGGVVVGETDPEGGRELVDPQDVTDLHATILTALGIDPSHEETAAIGRPIKFSEGKPIRKLLQDA